MRILFIVATEIEAGILLNITEKGTFSDQFSFGGHEINTLITGVGGISTAWSMKQWLSMNPAPDLAINTGIAGSYNDEIKTGDVVITVTDCFADLGIGSEDKIMTLFEAGLSDPDQFPFSGGVIHCQNRFIGKVGADIKKVNAATVNTCSGSVSAISRIKNKFNPDIETMEGATFFYICAREKIPFLSVRSVSNKVEPGNRESWNIPLALDSLAEKIKEILLILN
jgi:futalosine hydrolase